MVKLSIAARSHSEEGVKGQSKLKVISLALNTLFSTRIWERMCLLRRKRGREWKGRSCFLGRVLRVTNETIYGLVSFELYSQVSHLKRLPPYKFLILSLQLTIGERKIKILLYILFALYIKVDHLSSLLFNLLSFFVFKIYGREVLVI